MRWIKSIFLCLSLSLRSLFMSSSLWFSFLSWSLFLSRNRHAPTYSSSHTPVHSATYIEGTHPQKKKRERKKERTKESLADMPRFSSSSGRDALVTLKQKKKSLADAVNEQLTASALGGGANGDSSHYYADGGVAEDYDFDRADDDGDDMEEEMSSYGASKAAQRASAAAKKGSKKGAAASSSSASRLRHRGPLDSSLSEGKYAATPVNVESAMDDIFGALDMGDMDAEGEEFLDDASDGEADEMSSMGDDKHSEEEGVGVKRAKKKSKRGSEAEAASGASKARKRRRAKDLTEEEYTAWLEQKSKSEKQSGQRRRPLSFGGGADGVHDAAVSAEEADILRQLNELRQTQHVSLVPSAELADGTGASGASAAAAAAQSDAKDTRDVVQHFIVVYGQLLRLRVLLQPAVTRAISVPQYYARSLFTERSAAIAKAVNAAEGSQAVEELDAQREAAAEKYEELQEEIEDVLSTLYAAATGHSSHDHEDDERVSAAANGSRSTHERQRKRAKLEVPSYRAVERYHERVLRHADHCLEYWGSKLVQANSAKLKTISQPLPQQIAAILTARSRLRTKVQKNRSHLAILAHPEHVLAATSADVKARRAMRIAEGDIDAEIYDDADFLRELVRRGGSVANQLEQKVKEMQQALLPSREGARKGFHRMTKGKAVNYEPRPKLVGFMMAESLDNTQRNDVVVKSLFQ